MKDFLWGLQLELYETDGTITNSTIWSQKIYAEISLALPKWNLLFGDHILPCFYKADKQTKGLPIGKVWGSFIPGVPNLVGRSPLLGRELFRTWPQKWQPNMHTSPPARAAVGVHACCSRKMELRVHACRLLARNHSPHIRKGGKVGELCFTQFRHRGYRTLNQTF